MKIIFAIGILLGIHSACFGQNKLYLRDDSIKQRIILVGDAGDPGAIVNGKAAVLDAIRRSVQMDKQTTVLFMGDNIYINGLPCENDVCYAGAIGILDTQVALVSGTDAKAIFIPGNHDWANGKPEGYDNIIRQSAYLNQMGDNIKFYPEDGCPGPVEVKMGNDIVLIIMDSQWWLMRANRPGIESDCENKTEEEILVAIKDIIDDNPNKLILFTTHHPFKSSGVHSGYFGLKQHIFPLTDIKKNLYIPLPIIGSIYPISRSVFGTPQDMKYPLYASMINKVDEVLKEYPYVIHLAGHEHNLQWIHDSNYNYIVSGGGCKAQRAAKHKKTKYVSGNMGFAVMDISVNKNVRLSFFEVKPKANSVEKAFSEVMLNYSRVPELAKDTATMHETVYMDSVTKAVNIDYEKVSGTHKVIFGRNYRKEWATPVKFKVFNIKENRGGFKIVKLAGGKQTRSLRLKDKDGKEWRLRSINKNPEKVIPHNFRNTFAQKLVQDMISAANPYGAIAVPPLADALGLVHATPEYYLVPNDYALGRYRPIFANSICMLEEQEPTKDGGKDKSTMAVFSKMREKNNYKIDQHTLLKARMLDFLIADYDRHHDQWKWGTTDSGKWKVFYPIPHDRDQAFFYSDGWLMKYVTFHRMPFLNGFQDEMSRVKWQGFVARYFDRQYLNEIDEHQWKQILAEVKTKLTDSVITESVKKFPPEIARLDSHMVAEKLRIRRNILPEKSLQYYRFLAKRVNVLGSNNDEYFTINGNSRKGLDIKVYARERNGDTGLLMYSRSFDPEVTKEIRLYGFNGNDVFASNPAARSKIKVIMVGGVGQDTFRMNGNIHNAIYDFKKEGNYIGACRRTRNMLSADPLVNTYNEKEEYYTRWRWPHLEMGYNIEDGFLLGAGIMARTYNFRKHPYSSDQRFASLFALGNKAFQLRYNGDFRHVVGNTDLVVAARYVDPTLDNFFGFGNETKKIKDVNIYYYRVRYKALSGSVLVTKRYFRNLLSIGIGPAYYSYSLEKNINKDRLIAYPGLLGLDSGIYRPKSYAGGQLMLNVNNVNAELFPTRGVDWTTSLTSMQGLNSNSKPITTFESNMTVYASIANLSNVVALLRLGGGHIFSRQYEYFQALTLGANNYLRGYRKDRFAGSSVAYFDIELRVKLLDVNSYYVPGSLGIVGFNDVGRVWVKGEESDKWHNAFGGGLYFTPFNMVLLSLTAAFSGEEILPNFTVGTKINMTY
ncbi:MAG: metallophosphoesterase [Flavipsychrobacter sp.]|jgi:hypothetical protein|nr:metallophosphoesterase [Flavipsychrobacter sp.]